MRHAPLPVLLRALAAVCLAWVLPSGAPAQDGGAPATVDGYDGRGYMQEFEDRKPDDQYSRMTVRLLGRGGGERVRIVDRWVKEYEDGSSRVLIRTVAPKAVQDTAVLTIENLDREDDQWVYLPEQRRIRRVVSAEVHERFIGSDFTFEDLRAEDLDAHEYSISGLEQVDGRECVLVESIPATPEEAEESLYGHRVFAMDRREFIPIEIRYYDKQGAFLKVQRNQEWNEYNGVLRPDHVEMENVQEETRTVLEFDGWHCNEGIDDRVFSKRSLEGKL